MLIKPENVLILMFGSSILVRGYWIAFKHEMISHPGGHRLLQQKVESALPFQKLPYAM